MAYLLLNAAMVPNEGTFVYRVISREEAAEWLSRRLKTAGHRTVIDADSYIGYPQTAEHIHSLARAAAPPAIRRTKTFMAPGDEALVVKLAYRVSDPGTKGQPQPEDWEYGILRRLE